MSSIKLSDELIAEARRNAAIHHRSVPKQIEYWSKIGRLAEQNPDLPFEFIQGILTAMQEPSEPFEFDRSGE